MSQYNSRNMDDYISPTKRYEESPRINKTLSGEKYISLTDPKFLNKF